jgi:hypothetical protein
MAPNTPHFAVSGQTSGCKALASRPNAQIDYGGTLIGKKKRRKIG